MKRVKLFIFTVIMLSLFLFNASAGTFTCKIGGYNVKYDTSGKIVEVEGFQNKILSSDFAPKKVSECPSSNEGKVQLTDGGISLYIASLSDEELKQDKGGCSSYTYEKSCRGNEFYSCIWNNFEMDGKSYTYCNTDSLLYVKCGDAKDIPYQVPQVVSFAVNFLKILTPLILIFVSIISLLKAISAGNEDEMKKAQKGLIRKIIAAVMVFFIISIVQFVIMKVADDGAETENLSDCLNCFLNNKCKESVYFKTYIGSELIETPVTEISK